MTVKKNEYVSCPNCGPSFAVGIIHKDMEKTTVDRNYSGSSLRTNYLCERCKQISEALADPDLVQDREAPAGHRSAPQSQY